MVYAVKLSFSLTLPLGVLINETLYYTVIILYFAKYWSFSNGVILSANLQSWHCKLRLGLLLGCLNIVSLDQMLQCSQQHPSFEDLMACPPRELYCLQNVLLTRRIILSRFLSYLSSSSWPLMDMHSQEGSLVAISPFWEINRGPIWEQVSPKSLLFPQWSYVVPLNNPGLLILPTKATFNLSVSEISFSKESRYSYLSMPSYYTFDLYQDAYELKYLCWLKSIEWVVHENMRIRSKGLKYPR